MFAKLGTDAEILLLRELPTQPRVFTNVALPVLQCEAVTVQLTCVQEQVHWDVTESR